MEVSVGDFQFKSVTDNLALQAYRWAVEVPRGVVVIAHGLAEYALRYDRFARALNAAGFAVYALDHRGHGSSVTGEGLGDYGAGGWNGLVADLGQLVQIARDENPGVPLVLFGHSMGSFAAQQYCFDQSAQIDGLILSGSTCYDVLVAARLKNPDRPAGFAAYNKAFEPTRTDFDWLSRDEAEVDNYIESPLCGFALNAASGKTMQDAAPRFGDPAVIAGIRDDLPVLLVAGDTDPLNKNLELLHLLEQRWRDGGVRDIQTAYYPGGRHEMLNEINRDEVTADILAWLDGSVL